MFHPGRITTPTVRLIVRVACAPDLSSVALLPLAKAARRLKTCTALLLHARLVKNLRALEYEFCRLQTVTPLTSSAD